MFSGYFICPRLTAGGSIFWSLMTIRRIVPAVVDVPERLQKLEGEEEIDFAVRDEGRIDLLAVPEMGGDIAASLRHAVDLALLHVIARFDKDMGKDVAREDRTLAADTGE